MSCRGCGTDDQLEGHHVIPRTYGGETGPVVELCATCHSRVHKMANALIRGLVLPPMDESIQQNLISVARAIVKAHQIRKEHPEHFQDMELHVLQIRVSPTQLARLHKLKADRGYTSIDAFMSTVIAKLTGTA